jgi:hypothetical protein
MIPFWKFRNNIAKNRHLIAKSRLKKLLNISLYSRRCYIRNNIAKFCYFLAIFFMGEHLQIDRYYPWKNKELVIT